MYARRLAGDTQTGKKKRCGNCAQFGHNMVGCSNATNQAYQALSQYQLFLFRHTPGRLKLAS